MSAEIEKIAEKRQRWIDANKENNFEEGIKRLLTELYPDNAHFIYELLQNAEDPGASTVRFILTEQEMEFEHNGERLFNSKDVESITSIGVSTKREDPTSIGKFGVGFKAVFAYTNTPEIHSGEYQFRIKDLVGPITKDVRKLSIGQNRTKFIFPFDHPTKKPKAAVDDIARGLSALKDNTLLFLSYIRKIEYMLPDGAMGSLERVDHKDGHIEINVLHPGYEKVITRWLRYEKDIEVEDDVQISKKCRVAIAYNLQPDENRNKISDWKVVPVERGQVSIFFPAEKESSNLKFHLHAPCASTVARDSVRDCEANDQLCEGLADLVVESLSDIRDKGLLNNSFLTVMPNLLDTILPFYEPIYTAVLDAFNNKPLTPTKSGEYAPAQTLYRGPVKISEVIKDKELSFLTHINRKWAANSPQQNQRDDRFLSSLNIPEWGWNELASLALHNGSTSANPVELLISEKSDVWLMRFYALIGEACDVHYKRFNAEKLCIVRVKDGENVRFVEPKDAFFPPEKNSSLPSDIKIVVPEVYNNGKSESQKKYAVSFLERIGVRRYEEKTIVELKLAKYGIPIKEIGEEHYLDLKHFISYWKKTQDIQIFKGKSFLIGCDQSNKLFWKNSNELCIDTPFEKTALRQFISIHGKYILWDGYKKHFTDSELTDFVEFLKKLGITNGLAVSKANVWSNPLSAELLKGLQRTRDSQYSIKEDYSIKGLDTYVSYKSQDVSRLIWNALIQADSRVGKARYRPNQQYRTREVDSQLVQYLNTNSWIPDENGVFQRPKNMTVRQLPKDFIFCEKNGLLNAIGFGENAKKLSEEYSLKNQDAKKIGFESADEATVMAEFARKLRDSGLSLKTVETFISTGEKKAAEFPIKRVINPERRQERFAEQFEDAAQKNFAMRPRSVRTTKGSIEPAAFLRALYTNHDELMICQICEEEMPFRKRNGEHYFEVKEALSLKYFVKEHAAQYLALCPLCSAKYSEFVKSDEQAMEKIKSAIIFSEEALLPVALGKEVTTIRFVESHFYDLKSILNE